MDIFNKQDFVRLTQYRSDNCISIYMPTHRAGQEVNKGEDRIRFKNTLQEVEEGLRRKKLRSNEITKLLKPSKELLENSSFWHNQYGGLAVFMAPNVFERFVFPSHVSAFSYINNRFYLKPTIDMLSSNGKYFILSIAKGNVKLYEATIHTLTEINLKNIAPRNMEEALQLDKRDESLQFHSGVGRVEKINAESGLRVRGAMFHGHGGIAEFEKENTLLYLNILDKAILKHIENNETPMVIAGVDYILAMYLQVTNHKNILTANTGNTEYIHDTELHELANKTVSPYFEQNRFKAMYHLKNAEHTQHASSKINQVIPAAFSGQVDTLFLDRDKVVWGYFDRNTYLPVIHNERNQGDYCLLNEAAIQTILNNGKVYLEDGSNMPGEDREAAALFRF